MHPSESTPIYLGSYTAGKKSQGLYTLSTKDATVTATKLPNVNLIDPSFVLAKNGFLYAVEEVNKGRINAIDGSYRVVKTVGTNGDGPCHLAVNPMANRIVATNYDSGSFAMYELKDSIPTKLLALVVHEGSSVDKKRQASPHPHCSMFVDDGKILFVADLGTDIVYYYTVKYDGGSENIVCQKDKCIKLVGSGPRHLAKGEDNKKIVYLSCQLDSTIRVLSYSTGKLQQISAHKISQNLKNTPSQVYYTPTNKLVYIANRGDDNICVFATESSGDVTPKLQFKVGKEPRHFKVSKEGFVYVACEGGNVVEVFKWVDGKIVSVGSVRVVTPTCIAFEEI